MKVEHFKTKQGMRQKLTTILSVVCLSVTAQSNVLILPEGWSMFGYTCTDSIDVADGFSPIENEVFGIKDQDGLMYMPYYQFNAIGMLEYAEGYKIKMRNEVIGFQLCEMPYMGVDQSYVDSIVEAAIDSVNNIWLSIPTPFTIPQGVSSMLSTYQQLKSYDGIPHALTFGSGEVLTPGVYDVDGAASISVGTLTLDAQGDDSALFIIRSAGAFTTGVGSEVVLINGAKSSNVFWLSEVAISTAANTIMKGSLVSSAGAVSLGAGTSLDGRMLTKLGAVSIVTDCHVQVPQGDSQLDLGALESFVMWTTGGAISDAATSSINGDVGNSIGALSLTGLHIGNQY